MFHSILGGVPVRVVVLERPIHKVDEASERIEKSDVRYRLVIDKPRWPEQSSFRQEMRGITMSMPDL